MSMDKKEKIVMISPYPELSELAQKIAVEQHRNVEIFTAVLGEGVEIAKKMEQEQAAIFISRGATGALIRAAVTTPVILLEITTFDVLEALHKAKDINPETVFFDYSYHQGKYDLEKVKKILGIKKLKVYYYRSEKELNDQIEKTAAEGSEVVVASGICIINQAAESGMKGVMIGSSRDALVEAFARAEEMISIRKKDRQIAERLKTIINHSYGGVIAVDSSCRVTHYNPAAEEAVGLPSEKVIGRVITELKNEKYLQRLYSAGEPVQGDLQDIRGRKYSVSRVPLKLDSENFGKVITFHDVSKLQRLEAKIRKKLYAEGLVTKFNFSDIIGSSKVMQQTIARAKKYSQTDATILITGESGTGKELFVQSIHQNSKRSQGPFVAINCAAMPENLLESELFGYEEGAFTGAKKGGNPGLFEIAHGGALFLDEVLELTLPLQARLLRVLQEKAVRRVGGHKVIPVDVRIFAATNRDMRLAVREGKFREDLYFRLNVLNLKIPSLRERSEDVAELVEYFLQKSRDFDGEIPPFPQLQLKRLRQYSWPGNVRELESFIEKYVLLVAGEPNTFKLTEELLADLYYSYPGQTEQSKPPNPLKGENGLGQAGENITIPLGTMEEMERSIIGKLLEGHSLNKEQLAKKIGISRTTLWKKLKEK